MLEHCDHCQAIQKAGEQNRPVYGAAINLAAASNLPSTSRLTVLRNSSGSFAIFAAIRRASSRPVCVCGISGGEGMARPDNQNI
jgi:hypothetical protein